MIPSASNRTARVLWVSHLVPYPPRAGVLSRAYNLLRESAGHHDVHLVSFVQSVWQRTFYGSLEDGLAEARRELERHCRVHDFVPIPSERWGRLGRAWLALSSLAGEPCYTVRWLRSSAMSHTLARLVSEHRFDLVHFDTISLAPYRSLFPGSAATLGHHNVESHMLERRAPHAGNSLSRAYFRQEARRLAAYEAEVAADFDVHITCSDLDSQRLAELAPGARTVDVPNGVDVEFFRVEQRPVVENDLVFVGTMDWYPNVAAVEFFLEEAWPELKRRRPDITFGVVGHNPPRKFLDRAREDSGLKVYGYVDDVRPYFQGARIFVCPIRDGGGTKLKVLEALAMECCVVAHPVACEGIDVADGAEVALAFSGADFVEAIDLLLDQPERRETLGRAGRERMLAAYSYPALGRRLADTWSEAIARHARGG